MNIHDEHGAIRILKDGTWLHAGAPIRRQDMVRLFARVLKRDAAGGYWLETPHEREPVEVEDAPFMAVELRCDASGAAFSLRTNLDDWVPVGPGHDLRVVAGDSGPATYLHVRDGLEARLTRAAYYDLVNHAVLSSAQVQGVWSRGVFYTVAPP